MLNTNHSLKFPETPYSNTIWLTSDWHLGQYRFDLMLRPFKNPDDHNNTLIHNYNSVVKPDDIVIVVGDCIFKQKPEYFDLLEKFNGHKVLIRGNHDRIFSDEQFSKYFYQIIPEGEGIDIDIESIPCYITHYPNCGKPDKFNLVGHVHDAWKYQLNMFNVGVDTNYLTPLNLNLIPVHFKTICNMCDEDIWIAYNQELNAKFYHNGRGKNVHYFNKK
jgi:calcineurin-like phosphoesterase family protein